MQKIAQWYLANKMAVNTSKTKFIIFHSRGKKIAQNIPAIVFNSNQITDYQEPSKIFPLERISNESENKYFKLLGVLLDEHLTFDYHVDSICKKLAKSLYYIRRAKNLLPVKNLPTLYYSMIHPHILYCLNIYSMATSATLKRISIKQKEAIRLICNSNYRAHTKDLFLKQKILPFEKQILIERQKFMHKYHHKKQPLSFNGLWITNAERNPDTVLRNANNYFVPTHNMEILQRSPLISFVKAWNMSCVSKLNPNLSQYLKDQVNIYMEELRNE